MTTLKVSVTGPLIERATARDSRHCMIAEAIQAARPHFKHVIVDLATIRWSNPRTGKRYVCLTPEKAAAELVRFDRGEPIEPFDLNLTPIQVTDMVRTERTQNADGEVVTKRRKPSRTRRLSVDERGRAVIKGGTPITTGHLSNVAAPDRSATASAAPVPPGDASNAVKSGRRFRQYGRRLLAD